jgi:hypothetical protein
MFESTTATPSSLARCLETLQLATHARVLSLELVRDRLETVASRARREAARIIHLADDLPVLPQSGPYADLLGFSDASEALADDQTTATAQSEAFALLASTASSEADRVQTTLESMLAPLSLGERNRIVSTPGADPIFGDSDGWNGAETLASDPPPAPVPPVPSPTQPIAPPIIPTPVPAPNPASPTPAASEEIATTAANAGVLEVPPPSLSIAIATLKLQNDPNYIAACVEEDEAGGYIPEEVVEALADTQSPPPDDDADDDEEADDLDEGTDLWKRTSSELVREVFGQPVSDADEARAQVVASYPDACARVLSEGRNRPTRYVILPHFGAGRRSALSSRCTSAAAAWIDAAKSLS